MRLQQKAPVWERAMLWVLIAFLLYTIWGFSAQPASESSETSGSISRKVAEWFFSEPTEAQYQLFEMLIRKTAHMTEYAVLMLALSHVLKETSDPHPDLRALLGVFLWASSDELHQYFVPGRACMLTDVLIDLMGAGFSVPIRYFCKTIAGKTGNISRVQRSKQKQV